MSLTKEIRFKYAQLGMAEKLIVLNVVVFILDALVPTLFQLPRDFFMRWFELPKALGVFIRQPWSLVTYSFFHSGFMHLFWNMILLYFSGRIFTNLFSNRRMLTIYMMGAVSGGLMFLLSYNIFPAFSEAESSLIGASAAVMAVFIFICAYLPDQEVRIIFFNMRLWHLGVIFVLLDLIRLPMGNAGGHFAHLGGALIGFLYARKLYEGKDLGRPVERFFGRIGQLWKQDRKSPLRTVHKRSGSVQQMQNVSKREYQKQIDAILDKISKSGYESLSKDEKDFLFKAGKED